MSKKKSSELVAAVESFEQQLEHFEETLGTFKRISLTSKKSLDRAADLLQQLASIEGEIGTNIQLVMKALAGTRDAQLARVEEVKTRAVELQSRSTAFQSLTAQFESLGSGAAALKDKLQNPESTVVDVAHELGMLVEQAEALQGRAKNESFDDVVHLADGLKNQLKAIRGKLAASQKTDE